MNRMQSNGKSHDMSKIIETITSVILMIALSACGSAGAAAPAAQDQNGQPSAAAAEASPEEQPAAAGENAEEGGSAVEAAPDTSASDGKTLVVVFSATGTTKGVADKIAAIENADIYEIKAAVEYTAADLNWNDSSSRSTKEQDDKSCRPEIGSEAVSLEGYTRIYIGYPIWWGEEPRIMDTFVESYDFTGITMIPFCTSGSSGIGRSGQNLADNAKSGNWLEGRRFPGNVSESELSSWIEGVG